MSAPNPPDSARRTAPDYTLYLVTDVTEPILGKRDLVRQVRNAVAGGATIVQHRDKHSATSTLVQKARALHAVTRAAGVPLVINDRVDVALAVGAEGVHLGQDDMDLATARRLLGPGAIIGISVGNAQEAEEAVRGGADYVGIGAMFGTPTKTDTTDILGTSGTQAVLAAVARAEASAGRRVGAVAIGGINASNVQRVMYQSASQQHPHQRALDGVAVVSAIMGSDDAAGAARTLRSLITSSEEAPFATLVYPAEVESKDLVEAYLGRDVPEVVRRLRATRPLCHNMTNLVVQNFAANVALAVGGSPIMANDGAEAKDLAVLGGSLVVNMGSATPGAVEHASTAVRAYNAAGGPVLLDPVGGGATQIRRDAVRTLLAVGYYDIIKGNESEILSVSAAATWPSTTTMKSEGANDPPSQQQQHGVDSAGDSGLSIRQKASVVRELAERRRCIVVMTGREDLVSDGVRVLKIGNGHALLGEVTGSGCALGTTIAAMAAVEKRDKLLAALSGLLLYEIAAEEAAAGEAGTGTAESGGGGSGGDEGKLVEEVVGPGSFIPRFIDQLSRLSKKSASGDFSWLAKAKVEPVELMTNGTAPK